MVKTNIFIEVSEEVNSQLVVPFKKNKSFTKLVASLLQGYMEDPYIKSYINGTLGNMHKASVELLDDAIFSMEDSLQAMGIYTDSLTQNNRKSMNLFKDITPREEVTDVAVATEDSSIREELNQLKEQNKNIMELLSNLVNDGVKLVEKSEAVLEVVETPDATEKSNTEGGVEFKSEIQIVRDTSNVDISEVEVVENLLATSEDELQESIKGKVKVIEDIEENVEEAEEDSIDASALLASLLVGSEYSF